MQAAKVRRVGFHGFVILVLAIGILAGAMVIAASNIEALPWTNSDRPAIEQSAPVSRPTDERSIDGQDRYAAPAREFNRPTDRP